MTKHQWRDSIKSIFSSHIDPDADEGLKGSKIEIEEKLSKILKLIKDEDPGENTENSNKEPLVELIEEFRKQYQSLYDRYDHLTSELRQKVHGKKDDSSSSSSDSDNASRAKSSKNGKVANEFQKLADGYKQECETANLEIADLKSKLIVAVEEKEALKSEYQTISLKSQEAEEKIEILTVEAARLKDENSEILVANSDLNVKLQNASEVEAELTQKLEDASNKMATLVSENQAAVDTIVVINETSDDLRATAAQLKDDKEVVLLEIDAVKGELYTTKQKLESAEEKVENLIQAQKAAEEEKKSVSLKVLELAEEIKQGHEKIQEVIGESSQLMEKCKDREKELLTHKEMHETHKSETATRTRDLELELESLHLHKSEMEKFKDDELSALLLKLEDREKDLSSQLQHLTTEKLVLLDDVKQAHNKIQELVTEVSQLRENLDVTNRYFIAHKEMHESHKTESTTRIKGLELELDELHSLKNEIEKQKGDELSALLLKLEDREKDLSSQLQHLTAEKLVLLDDIKQAHSKIQELVTEASQLRENLDDTKRDFFAHKEMHDTHKTESTTRIKGLGLELEELHSLKNDIEKQKDDELSALLMKLEDREKDLLSQVERLTADVNSLQLKVESLYTQNGVLEEQVIRKSSEALAQFQDLMDQVNEKQRELESLQSQKIESEMQLEKRSLEISEYLCQIETVKEKLSIKTADHLKLQDDKEGYVVMEKELQIELDSLRYLKGVLEEQLISASNDNALLQAEKGGLQDKIRDMEKTLSEREDQLCSLRKEFDVATTEASVQIGTLTVQINNLQHEFDSLNADKREFEFLIKKGNQESAESLRQIQNQNKELANKVTEQEKLLKEQKNAFNKLSEVQKQLEACFEECKENLQASERKIEEMTEDFQKTNELKNLKFDELEETIEDLKRELEIKGDEVTTLIENVRNIEVKLRLSNQKLRITEQLLNEKEDEHTAKEVKYQEDNKLLHERITTLCEEIFTYKEAQIRIKAEIVEKVNETFTGLDALSMKFEEDYGHIETCVYEILNELQVAKNWVKDKKNEEKKLKQDISHLVDNLKHVREHESLLTEKFGELEIKLHKTKDEKESLVTTVKQLEVKVEEFKKVTNEKVETLGELAKRLNEKDARILDLQEEKKEAIRQLCIWIDYHGERCNYLKDILSKRTGGRR